MCSKQHGMTLIELVLAMVIISVGLSGVLAAFQYAVRGSADPLIRKQMLAIAEEMMEEVTLKPITPAANVAPVACARNTYNDIVDYNGYATLNVCDIDGTALPTLAGYGIRVVVSDETLNSAVPAKRIRVTVTRGTENISLTSYRTGWAL